MKTGVNGSTTIHRELMIEEALLRTQDRNWYPLFVILRGVGV